MEKNNKKPLLIVFIVGTIMVLVVALALIASFFILTDGPNTTPIDEDILTIDVNDYPLEEQEFVAEIIEEIHTYPDYKARLITKYNVFIEEPDSAWVLNTYEIEDNRMMVGFVHQNGFKDSNGEMIYPSIFLISEEVSKDLDTEEYSTSLKKMVHFETKSRFTTDDSDLQEEHSIGYVGVRENEVGEHTMYIVHSKYHKTGTQLILDSTTEILPEVEEDFWSFIEGFRYVIYEIE